MYRGMLYGNGGEGWGVGIGEKWEIDAKGSSRKRDGRIEKRSSGVAPMLGGCVARL